MEFNNDPNWLARTAAAEDNQDVNVGGAPVLYLRRMTDPTGSPWYLTTQKEAGEYRKGAMYFQVGAPGLVNGFRGCDQDATYFSTATAARSAAETAGYRVLD
jgi:hypothetical protein